jgi:hypothetical protein
MEVLERGQPCPRVFRRMYSRRHGCPRSNRRNTSSEKAGSPARVGRGVRNTRSRPGSSGMRYGHIAHRFMLAESQNRLRTAIRWVSFSAVRIGTTSSARFLAGLLQTFQRRQRRLAFGGFLALARAAAQLDAAVIYSAFEHAIVVRAAHGSQFVFRGLR